jgi:putative intracellular protease/amidase
MDINCLLFDNFETLDLFGPVEVLGKLEECRIRFFSMTGGAISNRDTVRILTEPVVAIENHDVLLIPGGGGTRTLVKDDAFIRNLKGLAEKARWCLTVCTGSALLAKTGLLDGLEATSNKRAFEWARTSGENVHWQPGARWVTDRNYYTSSGVSAGMDMSLGFVRDHFGEDRAQKIARIMEYLWNDDKHNDMFAATAD